VGSRWLGRRGADIWPGRRAPYAHQIPRSEAGSFFLLLVLLVVYWTRVEWAPSLRVVGIIIIRYSILLGNSVEWNLKLDFGIWRQIPAHVKSKHLNTHMMNYTMIITVGARGPHETPILNMRQVTTERKFRKPNLTFVHCKHSYVVTKSTGSPFLYPNLGSQLTAYLSYTFVLSTHCEAEYSTRILRKLVCNKTIVNLVGRVARDYLNTKPSGKLKQATSISSS
jgi:hypothetical protein